VTLPDETGQPAAWAAPAVSASELLRLHRDQVIAYTTVPSPEEPGASQVAPLTRADLPPDVLRLVERYEAEHQDVELTPLRYVSLGPPGESAAAAADAALPAEGEVVSLAVTESIVDAERVEVRSRVLLAAVTRGTPS
jgi:hypothetical protein